MIVVLHHDDPPRDTMTGVTAIEGRHRRGMTTATTTDLPTGNRRLTLCGTTHAQHALDLVDTQTGTLTATSTTAGRLLLGLHLLSVSCLILSISVITIKSSAASWIASTCLLVANRYSTRYDDRRYDGRDDRYRERDHYYDRPPPMRGGYDDRRP